MTKMKYKNGLPISIFNLAKRHKILTAFMIIILPIQFLNFTGFCYGEFRYLTQHELLDRFLFGEDTEGMTEEQKIQKIKERGGEYPGCCRVNGEPINLNGTDRFINKLFGWYYLQVESHFPDSNTSDKREPMYVGFSSINSCGTRVLSNSGMTETVEAYNASIRSIKKFWENEK